MRRFVFAILLLLVFTIPLENILVFPGFGTFSRALGVAAAVFAVIAALASGRLRRLMPVHYLMGLFVLWAFLSLAWTRSPEQTPVAVIMYFQLCGMAWLVWEFARTRLGRILVMYAYILGACAALVSQWGSMSRIMRLPRGTALRFSGGGLDPNYFCLVIVIGIVFAAFCATERLVGSKLLRLGCLCYTVIASFAVLLAGSRTGLVLLLVCALLIVLSYTRRRALYVLAFVGGAAILYVAAPIRIAEPTLKRLAGTPEELRQGNWSGRWNIWEGALKEFWEHPIVGTGAGTFREVVVGRLQQELKRRVTSAHNSYLGVLADLGIIGLVLFCAILALGVGYALRLPKREWWLWIGALLISCAAAFVMNMDNRKLLWLILGLLTSEYGSLQAHRALARIADRKAMARSLAHQLARGGARPEGPPAFPRGVPVPARTSSA